MVLLLVLTRPSNLGRPERRLYEESRERLPFLLLVHGWIFGSFPLFIDTAFVRFFSHTSLHLQRVAIPLLLHRPYIPLDSFFPQQ